MARIAENYLMQFSVYGGELAVKEFVDGAYLRHCSDLGQAIEWDENQPTSLLLYSIINRVEKYIPLVNKEGQFIMIVDRQKLAEQVAIKVIKQQLG